MEKRSWRTPNELVTLKKPKRVRYDENHSDSKKTGCSGIANSEISPHSLNASDEIASDGITSDGIASDGIASDGIVLSAAVGAGLHDEIPLDWCLKSKIRISSKKDFMWLNASKSHHEAKAFAMLQGDKKFPNTLDEILVLFHQSRIVWMHPSYPLIDLFPRMGTNRVDHTHQNMSSVSERDANIMKDHWISAFNSVFQLLQCGHCPYLYVCADLVTILFVSDKIVKPHGIALLTPTTPGFRDAMRKQGVTYEMPLVETSTHAKYETADLEDTSWFKAATAPDTKRLLLVSETAALVSVQGTEFCALVNFILNHKTLVSSSGKFANIPPTLLSPVQFLGSTMFGLKMKRNKVKEATTREAELTDTYYIDFSGPILPHTVQQLQSVLDLTQCSIQFQHHETTSSFNQFFKQNI